jgi:hypothetical protein
MSQYCEITIDCPPGYPRPLDVLESVINNTENEIFDIDILRTLKEWKPLISKGSGKFGNFIWCMPYDLNETKFNIMKHQMWLEILKYYNSGSVRYSSLIQL